MSTKPHRQEMIADISSALGGGMIDLEMTPDDIDRAITYAFRRYRQRSDNSTKESFLAVDMLPEVQTYILPEGVQEVRGLYRRGTGTGGGGGGGQLDPFALAFTQNLFMIQNPGGVQGGSGSGFLASFDFATQFQQLAGRMFGRDLTYTWQPATRELMVHRRFLATETLMAHVYAAVPEEILILDPYAIDWLTKYATAQTKLRLGEARALYSSLAGPAGGITLNGSELKSEAIAELEKLDKEIQDGIDARTGFGISIG